MAPRVVGLCVALTALFVVVLWPSASFAAIVPACENDYESRPAMNPAPTDAGDTSCDASADDIDNSRVAPMCDLRGASSIAPPRLHGVTDVRFDRGRPCEGTDTFKTAVHSGRGDPPLTQTETTFEHAVLPSIEVVGLAAEPLLLEFPVRTDGPRSGVRVDIFHPPR